MATNSSWTEPVVVDPSNPPKYPYNKIQQSESGHSIEMDDTVGKERLRLQHRSGSFLEMQPDGTEVHKIYGDGYEIVLSDKNVLVKGQCNITIEGACVVNIKGDSIMNIDGNSTQYVKGDVTQQVDGAVSVSTGGDIDLASKGDITMSAQNVYINADLSVRGGITSTESISATNNISAGLQGYATLGFVTPGYITAGSTTALSVIPGSINTTGIITAGLPVATGLPGSIISTVLMRTKLAQFGQMTAAVAYGGNGYAAAVQVSDSVRSMAADRAIYNSHRHTGVQTGGGTSGTTTAPE